MVSLECRPPSLAIFIVVRYFHLSSYLEGSDFQSPIQLKDCIRLVHIHYTLREIASRKVMNRDFQGVNIEPWILGQAQMTTCWAGHLESIM